MGVRFPAKRCQVLSLTSAEISVASYNNTHTYSWMTCSLWIKASRSKTIQRKLYLKMFQHHNLVECSKQGGRLAINHIHKPPTHNALKHRHAHTHTHTWVHCVTPAMSAYTHIMVCVLPVVPTDTYAHSHAHQEGNSNRTHHTHSYCPRWISCTHHVERDGASSHSFVDITIIDAAALTSTLG